MFEREKYNVEFKEKITKSFLKTVCAFSNYNDGQIIFGINDNAEVVGIDVSDDTLLKIENMINDSIEPVPSFKIEIKNYYNNTIIILKVAKGKNTPYYYNKKAYKRSNTLTIEVDRLELNRLILEGVNLNYESMQSTNQDLKFSVLEKALVNELGIERINLDILKTLSLYNKEGFYNIAGNLLSDITDNENKGIDIIKFGKNLNQILFRRTLNKTSILDQYYKAIEIFETNYQIEEINGYNRFKKELIPKEAFRESIANAIVHRVWDVESPIKISMFEDKIEINSPGSLPSGISEVEYLRGSMSLLRNPIIASVFFRLNIIEKFGTGISRIIDSYNDSITKPSFNISTNSVAITLPLIDHDIPNLNKDELLVYKELKNNVELTRSEIEIALGYNKSKTTRILKKLTDKNLIKRFGNGPKTKYNVI
ncbi:MAG: putative DNA binding domain-containing protein [Desulfuromonadaceae bacterium]|nr:putative DNA binding domain-containing protein [Desulfuromonadaceae bacterium]